jgi:hypothetical protein
MDQYEIEEKLKCAILRILNLSALRLFGCLIYNFNINIIDTNYILNDIEIKNQILQEHRKNEIMRTLTANISIQNSKPTINIYSSFIENNTIPELTFILLHEILHFLNGDCISVAGINQNTFNLAADHIINCSLKKDISNLVFDSNKISLPQDHFIIYDIENTNLTKIEVYNFLSNNLEIKENIEIKQPQHKLGSDQNNKNKPESKEPESNESKEPESNEPESNEPESNESKEPESNEPESNESKEPESNEPESKELGANEITTSIIKGKIKRQSIEVMTDIIQSKTLESKLIVEQLRSEARTIIENISSSRGLESGSTFELIKDMLKIKIPWDILLDKAICSKILPNEDSRSWQYLKKRPMALNILMAGYEPEEKPCYLIIVCDTSGSISTKMLQKFSSIIIQSIKYFDMIRILKHDIYIKSDKIIESQNLIDEDIIFKFEGGGGTSHTYVFNEIETMFENDDDEISLVIILTDFYSNIVEIWNNYEWVKNIPICICLTTNRIKIPKYIDSNPILIDDE